MQICEKLTVERWNQCWDANQKVPFAYGGNQWVGYDNEESVSLKCDFIYEHGLGGGMVWSVETDDFHGTCGERFTLLKTLNRRLLNNGAVTSSTTTTSTISPTSSSTTTATTSTTWPWWSSSTAQTTLAPESSSTTPTQQSTTASGEFKCVSTGYFRDPMDCTKFYYCDKTTRFAFACPAGLYFDETVFVCNWANAVNC